MKLLLHLCFVCIVLPSWAQQRKLFVAAGQSNAVGMGDSALSKVYASSKLFEYRFSGDSLKVLTDPVGYSELHFEKANSGSMWPAFASEYSSLSKRDVIIVQAARGGSSCSNKAELSNYGTWDTTGNLPLFDSAIIKIKAAERKTGVKASGIIWSQGERDANAINTQQLTGEEYIFCMKKLINRFRKALGKNLSFYIVQTGFYLHHPQAGFDRVRAAQVLIAKEMKAVYIVYDQTGSFSDKGWMKDEIHYSQPALNNIGETIAKQILQKEKK
ncbi:MAG: sialate O-acetylesterase [Chitinophagaceae bacterium]